MELAGWWSTSGGLVAGTILRSLGLATCAAYHFSSCFLGQGQGRTDRTATVELLQYVSVQLVRPGGFWGVNHAKRDGDGG
uniref:Putative secreted protein n=1 Tax=Anopheles marajoara TaxID=58244 RepID=A0A2M4CBW9_9DIPT